MVGNPRIEKTPIKPIEHNNFSKIMKLLLDKHFYSIAKNVLEQIQIPVENMISLSSCP